MLETVAGIFQDGGIFMWVLLGVLVVAVFFILEQFIKLYVIFSEDSHQQASAAIDAVQKDNLQSALQDFQKSKSPLSRMLQGVLQALSAKKNYTQVEEYMERVAVREVPRLTSRLNYLSLMANIATLLGLLGTIAGLQLSFSSLGSVEASEKATMLARGISQAMNTTAFGLTIAVPCMIFFTIFSNRAAALSARMDEAVMSVMAAVKQSASDR